ncbi:hypothetical protein QZH41_015887, partial [Actinostola sp. cb2023]
RKRSKGALGQRGQMRHLPLFFSDQNDVDSFVDSYNTSEGAEIEKDCSRFHAGEVLSSLRSKGKNRIFEEKGVFGRVCRHDYPKGFLNLKYGERISYSVYELGQLKNEIKGKNLSLVIMYDIHVVACILDKHLQSTNQANLLDGVGLAIPIFHCYGHKASCQVKYSPRRLEGVGLTDGEGVERLWSFLRDFSRMTKEMAADKRTDVLTDALLYYGGKLRRKFGVSLKGKLSRAESLLHETEIKIMDLSKSFPVPCSTQQIEEWQSAELASITPREKVLELDLQERYVDLLMENKKTKDSTQHRGRGQNELVYATDEDLQKVEEIQRKKRSNERALAAIEKKQRLTTRWEDGDALFQATKKRLVHKKKENFLLKMQRMASERLFLPEMKKKYADGQSIAIKLSKQISRVTDHIRRNMMTCNGLGTNVLHFEDVKDPCSSVYSYSVNSSMQVPNSIKTQLVDLLCLKKRCEEEIALVKKEMIQLLSFHLSQINFIDECTQSLTDTVLDKGVKALLSAKKLSLQLNRTRLEELWQKLNVSPYQWEEVVTWTCISKVPVIVSNIMNGEDQLDEEGSDGDAGDDEYEDEYLQWDFDEE